MLAAIPFSTSLCIASDTSRVFGSTFRSIVAAYRIVMMQPEAGSSTSIRRRRKRDAITAVAS
jgi:hypothetical protein